MKKNASTENDKRIKINTIMTIEIEKLTPSDCNCTLACSHSYGGGRVRDYQMRAVNLGLTKSGKVKLLVFGKMYWKNTEDERRIRYVEKERVTLTDRGLKF